MKIQKLRNLNPIEMSFIATMPVVPMWYSFVDSSASVQRELGTIQSKLNHLDTIVSVNILLYLVNHRVYILHLQSTNVY